MTQPDIQQYPHFIEVFKNLPSHYFEDFNEDFVLLLAALKLHDFTILRADEGSTPGSKNDLWTELSHPSVWICAASTHQLVQRLKNASRGSQEHTTLSNQIVQANLSEQGRLLRLLENFYTTRHTPFYARLIIETVELGESYLRCQGSSVRIILEDTKLQKKWLKDANDEMKAFAEYLVSKKVDDLL